MEGVRRRQDLEAHEKKELRAGAALSTNPTLCQREYPQEPDEFRLAFQRDYTRVIHSRAFRRLRHKTQVFISPRNDHLCTRLEHSLHVASVAATIARALSLNEDLVRAIAVGHDLGHAPFGHEGERTLHKIAVERCLEFCHEFHSLRIVDRLDSPYHDHVGLNLTFAVRDGIACHYGEGFEEKLEPDTSKLPEQLVGMCKEQRGHVQPATIEGCVVRWSDKIAYLGRDLEDALEIKQIEETSVPELVRERLGTKNREIINALIVDLVENSSNTSLQVSNDTHEALNELYKFNMDEIYLSEVTLH